MCVQIDANECEWYGEQDCRPWRVMIGGMVTCVVIDVFACTARGFVGRAMAESPRPRIRQCAPTLCCEHCLVLRI